MRLPANSDFALVKQFHTPCVLNIILVWRWRKSKKFQDKLIIALISQRNLMRFAPAISSWSDDKENQKFPRINWTLISQRNLIRFATAISSWSNDEENQKISKLNWTLIFQWNLIRFAQANNWRRANVILWPQYEMY